MGVMLSRLAGNDKLRRWWMGLVGIIGLIGLIDLRAAEEEAAWHLMVEPAYMRSGLSESIPGSEDTVVTPVLIRGGEVRPVRADVVDGETLDLATIRRLAKESASVELGKLEPRLVRDEAGVIVFAVLESEDPVAASVVFAPEFAEKFRDTLGPDLLVAIPNRYRVYVFPELASRFAETADLVLSDYERTGFKGSTEVFRVTPDGLRAVGVFED